MLCCFVSGAETAGRRLQGAWPCSETYLHLAVVSYTSESRVRTGTATTYPPGGGLLSDVVELDVCVYIGLHG